MSRYAVLKDGTEVGRYAGKSEAKAMAASHYKGGRILTIQDLAPKNNQKEKIWQFDPAGAFVPIAN